jgi:threonine dehydratase
MSDTDDPTLAQVAALADQATAALGGVIPATPLQRNARLSALTSAEVWLKREDLQSVRSYKVRGAYHLMSQLTPAERASGVIAASAGNHAQGVAWSCAQLGIDGLIVVPTTTPRQKRERIAAIGGAHVTLLLHGETYDAAAEFAQQQAELTGRTLVHAFNDRRTIAGQASVAVEILAQLGGVAPDVVVAPVGGGGLLAGCGAWLRQHCPTTRILGVEPAGAACVAAGLAAGHPVTLPAIDTFVDGAAVRRTGQVALDLIQQIGPEMVSVPEGQVCSEMLALYQVDGLIAEPAGALASAALRRGPHDTRVDIPPGATVVVVVSGGNNDISRYNEVLERSLVHEGRKHYFLVSFPQEPGALRRFLDAILGPEDDIVLFEYVKKSNRESGPALVGIELGNPADLPALLERAEASPIRVERITPDTSFYRYLV